MKQGYRKLMDGGEMPQNVNECIVSKELADLNNLKVGDKIKLKLSIISLENNEQKVMNINVELTITGIYLDATEAYTSQFKISSLNRRNEVLTTLDTMINSFGNIMRVNAKYYLKKPSLLKDFEAELRAKGLDEYYLVSTDEAGYQKVVGPVEGLKKISLTFMIIVLIFGAVILMALSSIAVRERKYEIGVLRAMGMKKKKVALGLWIEMLINLLTNATGIENIMLSMSISGSREKNKKEHAYALLERVGIDRETAGRKVLKMSGGEQQRVGIARALSNNPDIVIADEPTGNLDSETEAAVLNILTSLTRDEGKSVIIATHSKKITSIADEIWGIYDGRLLFVKQT
jgi:ABC-type ATPase involved in cell division